MYQAVEVSRMVLKHEAALKEVDFSGRNSESQYLRMPSIIVQKRKHGAKFKGITCNHSRGFPSLPLDLHRTVPQHWPWEGWQSSPPGGVKVPRRAESRVLASLFGSVSSPAHSTQVSKPRAQPHAQSCQPVSQHLMCHRMKDCPRTEVTDVTKKGQMTKTHKGILMCVLRKI